jgi:hypothetical protein
MVAGNVLCSAVVALFWFTDLRAKLGYARTANHHGRCPPDRISRPYIDRECVDPTSIVRLRRPIKNTFTYLFIRCPNFARKSARLVRFMEVPMIYK